MTAITARWPKSMPAARSGWPCRRFAAGTGRCGYSSLSERGSNPPHRHNGVPGGLTDDELWRAARNRLAEEFSSRTEELHHKRQREGLTAAEKEEETNLVRGYENIMLIRAKAAQLLRTRGHDVSGLPGS